MGDEGDRGRFAELREAMVRRQLEARDITHPHVLEAMRKVPRERFVVPEDRDGSYDDSPLPIGSDQTISQPYIVALSLQLARAEPGKRALDIGTGSGYQAAVLAEIVDHVYGIEVCPELAEAAERRLRDLGYRNVTVRTGDGYGGWPEEAPFDLIVGAAAAPEVPQELIDQLAPGARLVLPVGAALQELVVVEMGRSGGVRRWSAGDVRFVPMVHGPDPAPKSESKPEADPPVPPSDDPIELEERCRIAASSEAVGSWQLRSGAVDRLVPEWSRLRPMPRGVALAAGVRIRLRSPLLRVDLDCTSATPGSVRVEQVKGPFESLTLERELDSAVEGECEIVDRVECVSRGPTILRRALVRNVGRWLRAGQRRIEQDVARHGACGGLPARVIISGSSGLIGSSLAPFLTAGGHGVRRLVRKAVSSDDEVEWDPRKGILDPTQLEGTDAVIHLAGENIAAGRWTPAKKAAAWESRVDATRLLCETLAKLDRPPPVIVSASAVGFYGDRGDARLTETDRAGTGFLAELCQAWESATAAAEKARIRVVHLRIGLVLTPRGGPLAALLPLARLGLCGPVGTGRQGMSWISIDDLLGVIHQAITDERLCGPVNAVAPHPVSQREFVQTLGRVLRRPAMLPLPAPVVRTVLGEMGERLLLDGAYILPEKLLGSSYPFETPELEPTLRNLLGRD